MALILQAKTTRQKLLNFKFERAVKKSDKHSHPPFFLTIFDLYKIKK